MIHSRINDRLRVVLNDVEMGTTVDEFLETGRQLANLAGDNYSVIWNLCHLELTQIETSFLTEMAAGLRAYSGSLGSDKRAFLVNSDAARDQITEYVGRLPAPWPWGVFTDVQEAIRWLNR